MSMGGGDRSIRIGGGGGGGGGGAGGAEDALTDAPSGISMAISR
ncbi:hypothetical protein [Sphingomonas parapaucimobilis]